MNRIIDLRNTPPTSGAVAQGGVGSPRGVQWPLDSRAIAFLTLVNDETQYATCLRYIDTLEVPSGCTVEKIAVLGAASVAEGYQRAMEASTARYKIYVHQDVYVVHRELLFELLSLFKTYPRLGMVGVLGTMRLPASGVWNVNNPFRSYGRIWEYWRQGGLYYLLGRANRRRVYITKFRSFVGDYLPAVAVDGPLMATQYDLPWLNPLRGFMLYDQVQSLEFIKAGLEVGIARQEAVWCIHWGPLQERSREQTRRRQVELEHKAAAFRQLYQAFIGMPARRLYEQYRRAGGWVMVGGEFGDESKDRRTIPGHLESPDLVRERLGIVIVTFNGREVLLRALRTLLPQCEALTKVDYQVVVVDNASTDGTAETVRREFPQVTVMANVSNDGLARGFNVGLRQLVFPSYVLVMHNETEFTAGTLARMVSHLREHPSTAGVVASFTNTDGTIQFQRMAIVEPLPRRPQRRQLVTFIGTTCALVRGDVFFDVGLYDERFDSHNEDLEWSLRAKRKGYRFAFLPEARVIHHRSVGSRQPRPAIVADRLVDNLWLLYKHGGRRWAAALYWAQRLVARWLAFRWRNDSEALRQLGRSMTRAEDLFRRFREENRQPQPSSHIGP